jgi:hypothetical protein
LTLWSLLCSILCWSLHHLTLSGVLFTRPSTGVFFTWRKNVCVYIGPDWRRVSVAASQ